MKIGLEIHQQIDSGKLFCRCPSVIRKDPPHKIIRRRMRAMFGETGEVDVAASYEQKKGKDIFYEYYTDTNCLVELDEEPPHDINKKALETAIKIGLLLNMDIVEELQIMRKVVVDGSNTSGFQRTALLGLNGYIDTKAGKVRVNRLYIEEDSARKMPSNETVFRLDRLGIPLVEIRTEPDIKSAEQAYETALKIGKLLRVCDVKRGIGTIRQDINISVDGGNKVEIKGFQDIKILKKTIEMEVERQKGFLEISKELRKRRAKPEGIYDITHIIKSTGFKSKGKALATKLKGFGGLIKKRAGYSWLGNEFAQVARNFGLGGVIHSDELPNYGIKKCDVEKIKKYMGCGENDAFLFVVGGGEGILKEIMRRAREFVKGVPKEVRMAKNDGTSVFLRPAPGSARMYPETDLLPVEIKRSYVRKLEKELPEKPEEVMERYISYGLSREQAEQMISSGYSKLFDKVMNMSGLKPSIIASIILSSPSEFKKIFKKEINVEENWLVPVLGLIERGVISKNLVPFVLKDLLDGKSLMEIEGSFVSERQIEEKAKKIISKNRGADIKKLVGLVIAEFKGRANPKKVYLVIKKLLKD